MSMPHGLPAASHQEDACLRHLRFGEAEEQDGELIRTAVYTNDLAQTFSVTARAGAEHSEALMELTDNLHAAFEAVADDDTFLRDIDPTERAHDPDGDEGGVTLEMRLDEPADEELAICGFYIDPPISPRNSPHRYAPQGNAMQVRLYVSRGRARLRLYNGGQPTGKVDERSAAGYTQWLGTRGVGQPRAHVIGLQDGTVYECRGAWRRL